MMIKKFSVFYFGIMMLHFYGCKTTYDLSTINKVVVYNSIFKNGSTNNILNAFESPHLRNIDVSQSKTYKIAPENMNIALKNAKVKKHRLQKLGGITFGGEFYESNKKHNFLYFENGNVIIDFTDKREYWLKEPLRYRA